jgi:hypothetical protein
VGEGELFIERDTQGRKGAGGIKGVAIDPVTQLINEKEQRAEISLTAKQHVAILKFSKNL